MILFYNKHRKDIRKASFIYLIFALVFVTILEKDYYLFETNLKDSIVLVIPKEDLMEKNNQLWVVKNTLPEEVHKQTETWVYQNIEYSNLSKILDKYTLMPETDGYRSLLLGKDKDIEYKKRENTLKNTRKILTVFAVLSILLLAFL